jgi:hypothetical protein
VKDEPENAPSNVDLKDVTMASLVEATVVEVGTVKPVQDFEALMERGEDFNKGTLTCLWVFILLDSRAEETGLNSFHDLNRIINLETLATSLNKPGHIFYKLILIWKGCYTE